MNLKPCPFCGSIPIHKYNEHIKKWYIECDNEKCKIQPSTDAHINKSVITREWNKRWVHTGEWLVSRRPDEFLRCTCSECGTVVPIYTKPKYCFECGAKMRIE